MEKNRAMQELVKYREKLIQYGKIVAEENPEHLKVDELKALIYRIFEELNKINVGLGYLYSDISLEIPDTVTREKVEELFINFIDLYNIICTPTNRIYNYIVENYSPERYPKILCVRDGKNTHLGRKLEMKGYNVVTVDSESSEIFSGRVKNGISKSVGVSGKFDIVKGQSYNSSEDMIDWANLVVGSKVSQCAEDLISIGKPAVFNINSNAEFYNVQFKGVPITSSKALVREISRCSGVSIKKDRNDVLNDGDLIFVCDGREREDGDR